MNKSLAEYIKTKRKASGMTQDEFSNAVGVGIHFIRDLEQGKETVRLDKVNKVLAYWGESLFPGNDGLTIEMDYFDEDQFRKRMRAYQGLNEHVIKLTETESVPMLKGLMQDDLKSVILYGSCVRGDYTEDSDIDLALITRCSREEANQYWDGLSWISADLASRFLTVTNFILCPADEYEEKKAWYPLYKNIASEGRIIYDAI
ncbi:MAG: nucleotidyltransferase domain-containing protein [Lachnospiraceae bacterium]|nr:nucleotidyltransferase domain-containing protein [Candidatus Equihabitans merdae]